MEKTRIVVFGGAHVSKLPVKNILKIKPKPEVIISEGVDSQDTFAIRNILRAPIFTGFMGMVYGPIMKLIPAERDSIKEIEKQLKVKTVVVEEGMTKVIDFLFPENWITFAVLFFAYYFFVPKSILNVLMMLIFFPVGLDVIYTISPRNKMMVQKAAETIRKNNFKSVFFYCGNWHKKEIVKLFIENGFEVKEL